jgi:hypothetical protein
LFSGPSQSCAEGLKRSGTPKRNGKLSEISGGGAPAFWPWE